MPRKPKVVYVPPKPKRQYNFIINGEEYYKSIVVYMITFGEKFYIGQTVSYKKRAGSHIREINGLVEMNPVERIWSYKTIQKHLQDNPDIFDITFDVLSVCETKEEAEKDESSWFSFIMDWKLNDSMLNWSLSSYYTDYNNTGVVNHDDPPMFPISMILL